MEDKITTLTLDMEARELILEILHEYCLKAQIEIGNTENSEIHDHLTRRLQAAEHILYGLSHIEPQGEYS